MEDKMGIIYRQYELDIKDTYKVKGCTVLNTSVGALVIKPYEGNEMKAQLENAVKEHLLNCGYEYVDLIARNKEGELISYNQYGNPYVIRQLYDGQECDLHNEKQVMCGVRELVRLHKALRSLQLPEELEKKLRCRKIKEDMENRLRGIKRVRRYIIEKKQKNLFEIEFLKLFREYISQGEQALSLLSDMDLEDEKLDLCHGSFDQHSIWFLGNGEVTINNFDKVIKCNQAMDMYHFLRKTMEKNEWNIELGLDMIEEYMAGIDGKRECLGVIQVFLLFPEKFWKVANQYYNKRKVWVSEKNQQKINSLTEQSEKRLKFIEAVKEYRI